MFMTVIKIDKNHSTFGPMKPDNRPFEQAWREDFPKSRKAPKPRKTKKLKGKQLQKAMAIAERYEA